MFSLRLNRLWLLDCYNLAYGSCHGYHSGWKFDKNIAGMIDL